jgi:MATE family multidrug resistance protein
MHLRPKDIRSELPLLLHLAIPLIAGELGWVSMSVVDTIMVGRLPHSAIAMSAAALAQVLFNTLAFGIGGILLGLDTLISQAFGAKEVPEANRWLLHGSILAVLLSAVLMALFSAGPLLLAHLPVDKAVLAQAVPAMRGLNYGTLPLMLAFAFRRYLQAANHARPIAFGLISANLINAGGDWLLMYGHRWHSIAIPAFGVTGSSWSTSFSRLYLMAIYLGAILWADRKHTYGLLKISRRIELQHIRKLFFLGAPAGAQIFVEIAIFALVTTLIATFGPLPLSGHQVALECASTTFMVPFAISAATSVRVGHCIGRVRAGFGTITEVVAAGWTGIGTGAAFMLIAC